MASTYLKFLSYDTTTKPLPPISTNSLKFKSSAFTTFSNTSNENNYAPQHKHKPIYEKNCTFFNWVHKKKFNNFHWNWTGTTKQTKHTATKGSENDRKFWTLTAISEKGTKHGTVSRGAVDVFRIRELPERERTRSCEVRLQLGGPCEKRKP